MSEFASVGEPGYLPYCGTCTGFVRCTRGKDAFECKFCGTSSRIVNGVDMFDQTAPTGHPKEETP